MKLLISLYSRTKPTPSDLLNGDDDVVDDIKVFGVCKKAAEVMGVAMTVTMTSEEVPSSDQVESLRGVVTTQLNIDTSKLEEVSAVPKFSGSLDLGILICPSFVPILTVSGLLIRLACMFGS